MIVENCSFTGEKLAGKLKLATINAQTVYYVITIFWGYIIQIDPLVAQGG
jgi:hypothetical protein